MDILANISDRDLSMLAGLALTAILFIGFTAFVQRVDNQRIAKHRALMAQLAANRDAYARNQGD
jgi:cell division protein FtsB